MSDLNSLHNRFVWVDIPVKDLDRAQKFYAEVLAIPVHKDQFGDYQFCVLDHHDGNGGCLVPTDGEISGSGPLVYLNVNNRIRDAVARTEASGGAIITPVESIGPHGYRAVIRDSEGNRIALHSTSNT